MTKDGPSALPAAPPLQEPSWEDPTGPASFITDSPNRPFSSGRGGETFAEDESTVQTRIKAAYISPRSFTA